MSRVAVYPGSFDPPTRGHLDVIGRAARVFDRVVVGVLENSAKTPLLATADRVALLASAAAKLGDGDVEVRSFTGLAVDFARAHGATLIVRGVRSVADLDLELPMAHTNREIAGVETLFLPAAGSLSHIHGRFVREIAAAGGDLARLVTPEVEAALRRRFGG